MKSLQRLHSLVIAGLRTTLRISRLDCGRTHGALLFFTVACKSKSLAKGRCGSVIKKQADANKAAAAARDMQLRPILEEMSGLTYRDIAQALTDRDIKTPPLKRPLMGSVVPPPSDCGETGKTRCAVTRERCDVGKLDHGSACLPASGSMHSATLKALSCGSTRIRRHTSATRNGGGKIYGGSIRDLTRISRLHRHQRLDVALSEAVKSVAQQQLRQGSSRSTSFSCCQPPPSGLNCSRRPELGDSSRRPIS